MRWAGGKIEKQISRQEAASLLLVRKNEATIIRPVCLFFCVEEILS